MNSRLLLPSLIVPLALLLTTCGTSSGTVNTPSGPVKDADEVNPGQTLEDFSRKSVLVVEESADRINRSTTSPEIKKRAVQWKIRTLHAFWDIMNMADPSLATLDIWCTTLQWKEFFATGAGKDHFGPDQQVAIEASKQIADAFDDAIRTSTPEDAYLAAKAAVESFAREHPMTGLHRMPFRISESTQIKLSFNWLKEIAMPWQLSEGVVEMADAVSEVAAAADRFSVSVGVLPMVTRWQVELLLLELDENKSMVDIRKSMTGVSEGIQAIARSTDTLPEDLRKEISITLDQVDEMQDGLRETLDTARDTVAETRNAIVELNHGIDKAQGTINDIGATTQYLAKAGEAWKPALEQFSLVVKQLDGDPTKPPRKPDTLIKLMRTAEGLAVSAVELKELFREFREIVASPELSARFDSIDQTARGTIDHTNLQMQDLVDHATLRLMQVIAASLLAGLVYRFVSPRLARRAPGKQAQP